MIFRRTLALALVGSTALSACREKPEPSAPASETGGTPRAEASSETGLGASASVKNTTPPPSSSTEASPEPFVPERVRGEAGAMGTHLTFAAYTTETLSKEKVQQAFDGAIAEIRRVEALMTTWNPDAELSKVNAAAGKSAVPVSDETLAVVRESIHASEMSQGAFDITFETLHGVWKFDQDLDPHPPAEKDIQAKLPFVGYRNIRIDDAKKTIQLAKTGTKISLGGIAKGYAVDRAVKVLDDAGLRSFYVQAGGDLFARGKKPDGSDWQAGIRDPRGADGQYFAMISLSDHAFSTAGDYERSYVVGGKRYHHIIDPRTGHPATASRSVTIWAKTALLADEIDDAVFIMGPEKGLKLVESLDDVGAVIVDAKNNLWISQRLKDKLKVVAAPTDGL